MAVFIRDATDKLHPLLSLIADEIPECRKITTGRRFCDEQIDIQIIFEIEGVPLICRLRDEPDAFLENKSAILETLRRDIEKWQYVGPPYRVIETDEEYKAFFAPEQKRRMAEVFLKCT